MSLGDFYDLDFNQFMAILEKWNEKEVAINREQWEMTRYLCFYQTLPNVEDPKRLKLTDVFEFPWDEKSIPEKPDQENSYSNGEMLSRIANYINSKKE
ncbi:hypothetical protein [Marinifilum flexuosum]|uniref:hypothetical protein n=1 Tax=Marinifilum flexuosum TaxID=1117708 RepID=UPI0024954A22|nr:hypothetical protein [Marinifilum flexuosum]